MKSLENANSCTKLTTPKAAALPAAKGAAVRHRSLNRMGPRRVAHHQSAGMRTKRSLSAKAAANANGAPAQPNNKSGEAGERTERAPGQIIAHTCLADKQEVH